MVPFLVSSFLLLNVLGRATNSEAKKDVGIVFDTD